MENNLKNQIYLREIGKNKSMKIKWNAVIENQKFWYILTNSWKTSGNWSDTNNLETFEVKDNQFQS